MTERLLSDNFFEKLRGTIEEDELKIIGVEHPYHLRYDYQAGYFYDPMGDLKGTMLDMIIFDIVYFYGNFGDNKNELWGQVWFLGFSKEDHAIVPMDYLCVMYVKGKSLNNLIESTIYAFAHLEMDPYYQMANVSVSFLSNPHLDSGDDSILKFNWMRVNDEVYTDYIEEKYREFYESIAFGEIKLEDHRLPMTMVSLRDYSKQEAIQLIQDIKDFQQMKR